MGYRRVKKDTYAKPIGHHFLTVELSDKPLISNWFKGANGEDIFLWSTDTYTEDSGTFLEWIKYYESNTRFNIHSLITSTGFEFLTIEQQFEL